MNWTPLPWPTEQEAMEYLHLNQADRDYNDYEDEIEACLIWMIEQQNIEWESYDDATRAEIMKQLHESETDDYEGL